MLIYTSVQDTGGALSVLNAKRYVSQMPLRKNILTRFPHSDTSSFLGDVRSVTINSNGLSYGLKVIESVQLLHYVSMLFLGADGVATQDNPGLLPCKNAEVVVQTRMPPDEANGDVSQLVIQCRQASLYWYHIRASR